jgi:hypothetical protein
MKLASAFHVDHLVPREVHTLVARIESGQGALNILVNDIFRVTKIQPHFAIIESPAFVGRAVAALAQDPTVSRWNGKSFSSGQLAKIYASPISTAANRMRGYTSPKFRTPANPPTSPDIVELYFSVFHIAKSSFRA